MIMTRKESLHGRMSDIYRNYGVDRDFERDCSIHAAGVDIIAYGMHGSKIAYGMYGNKLAIRANGIVMAYIGYDCVSESKVLPFRRVG